jgi:hypothetical protein
MAKRRAALPPSARAGTRAERQRGIRGAPEETALVARSAAMQRLLQEVRRYAKADSNVLITGETGAGKDLVAEALHRWSPRRMLPFIKIDCASMPASLMEAELFGFERGAFTDAATAKAGRFELAGAGTVYLDGISELPFDVQGKLLRAVEDKRVERLGGAASIEVRARFVASAADGIGFPRRPVPQAARAAAPRAAPSGTAGRHHAAGEALSEAGLGDSGAAGHAVLTGRARSAAAIPVAWERARASAHHRSSTSGS